jgi:hypothetical protein
MSAGRNGAEPVTGDGTALRKRRLRIDAAARVAVVSFAIAVCVFGAGRAAHAQDDPHTGTWKLNVAKSTFVPGPPLTSQTRTYAAYRDRYREGVKATVETVDANGARTTGGFMAFFDGGSYPETDDPRTTTVSLMRVDNSTIVGTLRRGGRVIMTTRNVVSRDGKVMTLTERGATDDGQPLFNVQVYDKQ